MNLKLIGILLITSCSAFAAPIGSTTVGTVHIGLSPFLRDRDRTRLQTQLTEFTLKAPRGCRITFHDAWNLETIVEIEVPFPRFDSPAVRIRQLAPQLSILLKWFDQLKNQRPDEARKGTAAILAPEFLEQITRHPLPRPAAIVLIGNPLRLDLREPAFTMQPDLYPSDAHLVASPDASVFSTIGKEHRLAGVAVHWIYPSESIWANELHAQRVRRFWTLFVSRQGGYLCDFTADFTSAFQTISDPHPNAVGSFEIDPHDDKLTMRSAAPREIPRWMPHVPVAAPATNVIRTPSHVTVTTRPAVTNRTAAGQPSPTPATATNAVIFPTPAYSAIGPVRSGPDNRLVGLAVGLMWHANADIDLYLRPSPTSAELCFFRIQSPEGRYVHDFRHANSRADYEWIELWDNANPNQVEAWVNYFAGSGRVSGTVCVYYQGRTHLGSFSLAATQGNHGGDPGHRASSPYWVKLDLSAILKPTN
jgi:hypothetical protein